MYQKNQNKKPVQVFHWPFSNITTNIECVLEKCVSIRRHQTQLPSKSSGILPKSKLGMCCCGKQEPWFIQNQTVSIQ